MKIVKWISTINVITWPKILLLGSSILPNLDPVCQIGWTWLQKTSTWQWRASPILRKDEFYMEWGLSEGAGFSRIPGHVALRLFGARVIGPGQRELLLLLGSEWYCLSAIQYSILNLICSDITFNIKRQCDLFYCTSIRYQHSILKCVCSILKSWNLDIPLGDPQAVIDVWYQRLVTSILNSETFNTVHL